MVREVVRLFRGQVAIFRCWVFSLNRDRVNGALFLFPIAVLVLIVPLLPSYSPEEVLIADRLLSVGSTSVNTGRLHILGTDSLGRDVLDMLSLAGRVGLGISFGAVVLATVIGGVFGAVAGYYGGWTDSLISTFMDIQLSLPRLVLVLAVLSVTSRNLVVMSLVLGLSSWMPVARVVRSLALSLRTREFVSAAQNYGASGAQILRHHIAPHVVNSLLIVSVINLNTLLLLEASLSFLGLGVSNPNTSWGLMVREGQRFAADSPHLSILPGLCLALFSLGVNIASRSFTDESEDWFTN